MGNTGPLRDVSDTAFWVGHYRALESARPDAVFRDPFAARLAGKRGEEISAALGAHKYLWVFTARTLLLDRIIERAVSEGCQQVVNLAAGLDARPYRLKLPADLRWVEVDMPRMIAYKEETLRDETPGCRLERIAADLSKAEVRAAVLKELSGRGLKTLVLSEGLLVYLDPTEVEGLASDLRVFSSWAFDLASPGTLRYQDPKWRSALAAAGASFKFAPPEGALWFEPRGWKLRSVESGMKTASKLGRLPWWMKLFAYLPESPERPWSGICWAESVKPN